MSPARARRRRPEQRIRFCSLETPLAAPTLTLTRQPRADAWHEAAEFLRPVRHLPLLSRLQTRELALRAQAGDRSARDRLVEHYLRLVAKIAFRHFGSVPIEDLMASGAHGLTRAVELWDPRRSPFATYARLWIRGAILRCLKRW